MSLPIPDLEHLEPCASCGHPRRNHHPRGCATDEAGRYEVRAQLNICPCTGYQEEHTVAPTYDPVFTNVEPADLEPADVEHAIITAWESILPLLPARLGEPTPPRLDFLIPAARTIVWQADDGSASLALHPDATVDIVTQLGLTLPQLQELSAAIMAMQARLGLAILARTVTTGIGGSDR